MKHVAIHLFCVMTAFSALYTQEDFSGSIHNYFWANYQQFKGNGSEAQEGYTKIFKNKTPCCLYSYRGYIHFLFENKRFEEIYALIPTVDERFKKDPNLQLICIAVLEKMGKQNEADERLIALQSNFTQNAEITLQTAQTYLRRKEPKNALLIIDKMLNSAPRKPNNFVFYFLKAQIYVQLNDLPKALEASKESIVLYPYFDKGWLLIASLQEQIGQLENAIDGYKKFLSITKVPTQYVEQHLFNLMLRQKMHGKLTNTPVTMKMTCYQKALQLFSQQEHTAALSQIESCLSQNPQDQESKLLKIEILSAKNEYLLALQCAKEWFEQSPQEPLWIKTIHLIGIKTNNRESTISIFDQLARQHTHNEWIPLYYADLLLRSNSVANALLQLEHAIKVSTDNTRRAAIYFQIGLIHFQNEQYEKAISSLQSGYKNDPTLTPLVNLLAYYWATAGKDLTKASYFAEKTLNSEPNNPYYQDTYALILYKQGQHQKAQDILEALIVKHPQDVTMNLHLAKIHRKQADLESAGKYLAVAQENSTNPHEKSSIAKLEHKIASVPDNTLYH